jgi:hypothetical protein
LYNGINHITNWAYKNPRNSRLIKKWCHKSWFKPFLQLKLLDLSQPFAHNLLIASEIHTVNERKSTIVSFWPVFSLFSFTHTIITPIVYLHNVYTVNVMRGCILCEEILVIKRSRLEKLIFINYFLVKFDIFLLYIFLRLKNMDQIKNTQGCIMIFTAQSPKYKFHV